MSAETSIVDKSVCELEIDLGEYRMMKDRLSAEKAGLQCQLADLKARCSIRLPQEKYHKIQVERAGVLKLLAEKEAEISELNQKAAELNTVKEVRKRQAGEILPSDMRRLVEIRDKWHGFSMDSDNHQKGREAAWKFSQELREVLAQIFNRKEFIDR